MKYFTSIDEETNLTQNTGSNLRAPEKLLALATLLISQCSFSQHLIQQIIYASHGAKLVDAKRSLKKFPNPKARFNFLCEFPYEHSDPALINVFDLARSIFKDVYEFRNILAHEVWASSEQFPESIIFSSLDANSRLQMAQGRLWHDSAVTPENVYDETIRFIRGAKVVTLPHIELAISDINVCLWILMNMHSLITTKDQEKKNAARQAFQRFKITSHLFSKGDQIPETVEFSNSSSKTIMGKSNLS